MTPRENEFGQPIGFAVDGWKPVHKPGRPTLSGRTCLVVPLDPEDHAAELHEAFTQPGGERLWTYLPYGPFASPEAFGAWVGASSASEDPEFFAIVDSATSRAVGVASYLRIEPATGVIEVGHLNFSPALQQTTAATEAMYLMMRHVFDELGYRRYEWKCDALNAPSRAAALRFGFEFEGIFRQATLYKGRNRDTAWFAITDRDWPERRAAFERWLEPDNFDGEGRQRRSLSACHSDP